jgi:hypothetical protein
MAGYHVKHMVPSFSRENYISYYEEYYFNKGDVFMNIEELKVYLIGLGLGATFASLMAILIGYRHGIKKYNKGYMDGQIAEALMVAKALEIDKETLDKAKYVMNPKKYDKILQFKGKES